VIGSALKLVGADAASTLSGAIRLGREFDDHVVSAFGEAFNNVVLHAYQGRAPGDIELEIDPDAHGIAIRILDFGASFDVTDVPTPDLDSLPERGMGIYIMRSFMDEVTYRPGYPNVLFLRKSLQGGSLLSKPADTHGALKGENR
jgi:serine/threonine-protein kinase RsbW